MPSLVLCALLLAVMALLVGHLILRVSRVTTNPWLAPAVGVCALMVVSDLVVRFPGRSVTAAVVVVLIAIVGAVVLVRDPVARPDVRGLVAGAPALGLALVPFLAAGRAGTLGVSFNNDMASHLLWADGLRDAAVEAVNPLPPDYPLGGHGLAATLADLVGTRTDIAFAGLTAALPLLLAWTAQAALSRDAGVVARTFVATLAGVPFMVAGYYGQGSFKEVLQAVLVLAFALSLHVAITERGRGRWVPAGLLVVGMLSTYSVQGLAWPGLIVFLGAAALLLAAVATRAAYLPRARRVLGDHLLPLGIGAAVVVVAMLPQARRLLEFFSNNAGTNLTGIPKDSLGNLAGPIPGWAALGVWDSADYRVAGADAFARGLWVGILLVAVVAGAAWWLRRGHWVVPLAGLAALLVWVYSERTQSPYVTAKALVVLAPFAMLMWTRPLAERDASWPRWTSVAAIAVGLVFGGKVLDGSIDALRFSKVGPSAHFEELRSLEPTLRGQRTLLLSNDDFTRWALRRTSVQSPVISFQQMEPRPEKPLVYGEAYDFDTVPSESYREFRWVISPRDPAGSRPPNGLTLVRRTRSFALYRVGSVEDRDVLAGERSAAGAPLECGTPEGRAVVRAGGTAGLRPTTMSVEVPPVVPGTNASVTLELQPGRWDLEMPYISERPVDVSAEGLRVRMPASLERPGTRWLIGRIVVDQAGPVPVRFAAVKKWLTPDSAAAYPTALVATKAEPREDVPVAKACGKVVDYVVASGAG